MSKIAIKSRADQGVLIDISACTSFEEALEQLNSTLQVSSQFWRGIEVYINLGNLALSPTQMEDFLSAANELGVVPIQIFAENRMTTISLADLGIKAGDAHPMNRRSCDPTSNVIGPTNNEEMDTQPASPPEIDTTGSRIIMCEAEPSTTDENQADTSSSNQANGNDIEACKNSTKEALSPVLYLRQTLRSGQAVTHNGHLVIIGDVNAGAEVVANGDISVWGALRGVAHAGASGNILSEIRALKLQPIQIRIAEAIARSPDTSSLQPSSGGGPETAKLVDGKIRILRNTLD